MELSLSGKIAQAQGFVSVFEDYAKTWGATDSWVQGNLKAWRETLADLQS